MAIQTIDHKRMPRAKTQRRKDQVGRFWGRKMVVAIVGGRACFQIRGKLFWRGGAQCRFKLVMDEQLQPAVLFVD